MTKYIVTGGFPLRGVVSLHGAKNVGFKAIITALLADTSSKISDLGLISEIDFSKQIICQLGGRITEQNDPHCLGIDPTSLNSWTISADLGGKSRNVIYYVGPLLARFGKATIPVPGGDTNIAKRPLDRHLAGLEALGATVNFSNNTYFFEAKNGLSGTTFRFPKNTHNGTEVLMIAAARAKGVTVLENAAAEPEIDDLIKYVNAMGGNIERVEPRVIKIIGVDHLSGADFTVMRDRNEAVTFACAALATKGDVTVLGADSHVLEAFLGKAAEIGALVQVKENGIRFAWEKPLRATDVATAPHPGFMTDWQALWTTLMTQAEGTSVVHETIFEKRFDHVPSLIKMGARIELFQPELADPEQTYNFNLEDDRPENKHAIRIFGPTPLTGSQIEVNDVRSGATALLAGITASGTTIVVDPKDQIIRGYEKLEEQLVSLGAKIQVQSRNAV